MIKRSFLFIFFICQCSLIGAQQTVGLFLNDSLSENGYTLFAPNRNTYLIDNCGKVVNQWQSTSNPGLAAYLLPDGRLLRTGSIVGDLMGSGAGGRLEIFDWEGNKAWSYDYSSEQYIQHHDIHPLPNGNILVLAWDVIPQELAIQSGRNSEVTNKNVWSEKIIELKPIGQDSIAIVWEWYAWDHLIQDQDSTKQNYGVVAEHPELIDANYAAENGDDIPGITGIDWLHANSVSYNPDRDEIILSLRNFNEIWVIDHSTTTEEASGHTGGNANKGGDLLFRWGNPQAYDRGTPEDQQFYQQHDAQFIPYGYPMAGKIMVFNNGNDRPGEKYSSVDFIAPPINADGAYDIGDNSAYGPQELSRTIDWYQSDRFYSSNQSGAHPLPNGNVLISTAADGHFFEIDLNDKLVWDYFNPVSLNGPVNQGATVPFQSVFRATKYPEDFIESEALDLSAGDPIERNPFPSDCIIHGAVVATVDFADRLQDIHLLSNPVDNEILLSNLSSKYLQVEIFDLRGRSWYQGQHHDESISIQVNGWEKGIYGIKILDKNTGRIWLAKVVKI